jgi:hypothetical protein
MASCGERQGTTGKRDLPVANITIHANFSDYASQHQSALSMQKLRLSPRGLNGVAVKLRNRNDSSATVVSTIDPLLPPCCGSGQPRGFAADRQTRVRGSCRYLVDRVHPARLGCGRPLANKFGATIAAVNAGLKLDFEA